LYVGIVPLIEDPLEGANEIREAPVGRPIGLEKPVRNRAQHEAPEVLLNFARRFPLKIAIGKIASQFGKAALLVPLKEAGDRVHRQIVYVRPQHVFPKRTDLSLLTKIGAGHAMTAIHDHPNGRTRRSVARDDPEGTWKPRLLHVNTWEP
jgi:hypothetical protein